jgi:hypothetical protein
MILLLCIVFVWLFLGQIVLTVLAAVASVIAVSFLDGILSALIPKSLVAYLKHKLNPPPPKRKRRRTYRRMTIYGPIPPEPLPQPFDFADELHITVMSGILLSIPIGGFIGILCDSLGIQVTGTLVVAIMVCLTLIVGYIRLQIRKHNAKF